MSYAPIGSVVSKIISFNGKHRQTDKFHYFLIEKGFGNFLLKKLLGLFCVRSNIA